MMDGVCDAHFMKRVLDTYKKISLKKLFAFSIVGSHNTGEHREPHRLRSALTIRAQGAIL